MSGVLCAASTVVASVVAPPPDPFHVSVTWRGVEDDGGVVNVSGISGQTSNPDNFGTSITGGVTPYLNDSYQVTGNSGKLSYNGGYIGWSGLNVGESGYIQMTRTADDSAGAHGSMTRTIVIKRVI